MLQDYRELATSLKEKFQSINYWPEIEFNEEDIKRIKELDDVIYVSKSSIQIKIESNHCVIPGQYVLYSICIKELALAVKEHLDAFELIRTGLSNNEVGLMLINQDFNFNETSLDDFSKTLALKIFIDRELNQDAKSIVNGNPGNYTIRGISDFYTSIILKPINIPAASSSILGKFIFNLSKKTDLYNYLEKRFIDKIPFVLKENRINRFAKNTISFLLQYDEISKIKKTFIKNSDPHFTSIKDEDLSLTSIFKTSPTLLDEESLSNGGKIRYFKDPIYLNEANEYVYFSTEWTDGTDSRLDLTNFKKLIEKFYPEFVISKLDETYFLKSKKGFLFSKVNSEKYNIDNLKTNLVNSGLKISDDLLYRFSSSLLTKPFVILTGLSGSGKTKLAQAFTFWICENENQYSIIPVGADWTNRDPLLGFPNGLEKESYVTPDSGALQLMMRAMEKENETKPYFLILDEMNLSHVERYFADFLSLMESKVKLMLYSGADRKSSDGTIIPKEISWPKNLFIIGTVNIDETTYMFSPKVLDRASVIEFRVTIEDMVIFLNNIQPLNMDVLKGKGAKMADDFVRIAIEDTIGENSTELKQALLDFFNELKRSGAEFGYRSAFEILRFADIMEKVESGWSPNKIIDAAIMQKLLPKLHGSRNKLSKILPILGGFCLTNKVKIKENYFDDIDSIKYIEDPNIIYRISFEKICRMYKNAIENGYANYTEA